MKKLIFCIAMFSVILLTSCGISKKQIEEEVREDFGEAIRDFHELGKVWEREGAKAQRVELVQNGVQNGLSKYDGTVYVLLKGKTYTVPISVAANRTSTEWLFKDENPLYFLVQYMDERDRVIEE